MEVKHNIDTWLSAQKSTLDDIICNSAKEFFDDNKDWENFDFDVRTCSSEMFGLSGDDDLCYDRPSIGFCYSLWYHGNRVSNLIGCFEDLMRKTTAKDSIVVYDLGAGTGAIQWALSLVYLAMKATGLAVPSLRIVNVDSSPFMLEYNQRYLWKNFIGKYPLATEIATEYTINNWTNSEDNKSSNTWICASYVFDHNENKEFLTNEFAKLVAEVLPFHILLFTSSQNIQIQYVNSVVDRIQSEGYSTIFNTPRTFYYSGDVEAVASFRKTRDCQNFGFVGTPSWDRSKFHSKLFTKTQIVVPQQVEELTIFKTPGLVRSKVKLTKKQEEAASYVGSPTIIIGPAGCGKSIVLTERIKKIVENPSRPYDPKLQILLTTFNKKLIKVLGDWLEQILEPSSAVRSFYKKTAYWGTTYIKDHCCFTFSGSKTPNIQILHFDVLPTILGKVSLKKLSDTNRYETFHRDLMKKVTIEYYAKHSLSLSEFSKISDPDFLIDEFERIIYGQQIQRRDEYLSVERIGRGNNPTLQYKTQRRRIVYDCIYEYLKELKKLGFENFQIRRRRLLKKLVDGGVSPMFTHILIDELQDCTGADYEIFKRLIEDQNNLTFAGDLAQSIQLGSAFHIPRGEDMKRFKKITLEGSFRIPLRISEAIKPLSVRINRRYGSREGVEADVIIPYRGAQPGARPIVVFATNQDDMATKIREILKRYVIFCRTPNVSLFEKDDQLYSILKDVVNIGNDVILKNKGLEFPCVVWSSRILADTKLEQEEFAYTIFTRAYSILIIAVFPDIDSRLKEIVRIFERRRSIYWDSETVDAMNKIRGSNAIDEDVDEDMTGEITEDSDSENLDELL